MDGCLTVFEIFTDLFDLVNELMSKCVKIYMSGRVNGCVDEFLDGYLNGCGDGCLHGCVDGCVHGKRKK